MSSFNSPFSFTYIYNDDGTATLTNHNYNDSVIIFDESVVNCLKDINPKNFYFELPEKIWHIYHRAKSRKSTDHKIGFISGTIKQDGKKITCTNSVGLFNMNKIFKLQENQSISTTGKHLLSQSEIFIKTLIEIADRGSLEIKITFFVEGTVISGILIDEELYFEALKDEVHNYNFATNETIHSFVDSFQTPINKSNLLEEHKALKNCDFIHLKNASIHLGNSTMSTNKKVYWRGSLHTVDGFLLGN